jgi:predicted anti-sigma-YlaC factor YlaD
MHLLSFHDWIRRIYATREDELDCDQVFEELPQYVDREIAAQDKPKNAPQIEQHLMQCPHCQELYLALREAAMLEAQEQAPTELVGLEHCEHR